VATKDPDGLFLQADKKSDLSRLVELFPKDVGAFRIIHPKAART
jgi:hypothetical protein